jgi:hypothetical protein
MRLQTPTLFLAAACVAALPAAASAHFPFLVVKRDGGTEHLHVYFSDSAEPDDPDLLDRLSGADVWRVRGDGSDEPLTLSKGSDSLTTDVPAAGPAAYGFHKDYGLLSRGGETFSLVYYAKAFNGPEAWAIRPGKRNRLDVVPKRDGGRLTLTVLWDGEPLPDAEVVVQGDGDPEKGTTDGEGRFTCKAAGQGLTSIRVKHVEAKSGERNGKKFDAVRHYSTLTLDLK